MEKFVANWDDQLNKLPSKAAMRISVKQFSNASNQTHDELFERFQSFVVELLS